MGEGVAAAVRPNPALQVRPVPYRVHGLVPGGGGEGGAEGYSPSPALLSFCRYTCQALRCVRYMCT